MDPKRRTSDALRAVDGLIHAHLQQAGVDARALANLAIAMVIEYSGSGRGALLLDDGDGLRPVFALGPGQQAIVPDASCFDAKLVEQARLLQAPVRGDDRLACPIQYGGRVHGVIYLEAGMGRLDGEAEDLGRAVATRIATLLHSASLIEDSARRERNVRTLEALGDCLNAGTLSDETLGRAVDAALESTGSDEAFLGLAAEDGSLLDIHTRAADGELARALGRRIGERAAEGAEGIARALGEPSLVEALLADYLGTTHTASRRPLGYLAVRRLAPRPYGPNERTVFRALVHLLSGALARIAYFRKASEDTLTGTGSRLALELAIVEAVDTARRAGQLLSVALLDVDRFKEVNDSQGHLAGDAILKAIGSLLRARLRGRDFVARFGGDEFIVLLPETGPEDARRVAEELRGLVAAERLGAGPLYPTLSIGIATYPLHGDSPRELVRRADEALYAAKAAGRNRVALA